MSGSPDPTAGIELRHLRQFVAVAEELSFTRAAQRLSFSQQSLSESIRRLERAVGVPLLLRTTRSVTLTSAGVGLLEDARDLIRRTDEAVARAQAAGNKVTGHLLIGCSFDLAPLMSALLRSLRADVPGIEVDVVIGAQRDLLRDLRSRRMDLVLTWAVTADDRHDVMTRTLRRDPLWAAVRADHPSAGLPALPREMLLDHDLVIHHRDVAPGPYDEIIDQAFGDGPIGTLRFVDVLSSGHEARAVSLRSDGGIALGSKTAFANVDLDGLVVLPTDPPMTVSIELGWREDVSPVAFVALSHFADAPRPA